ncbi:MAG: hypothetical protein ABSH34_02560 [Verrucomicrobiota bacterium]
MKDLRNRFPRIAAWIEQGQAVARRVISPGLALIACVVLAGVAGGAPREGPFVLGGRAEGLALNADGALLGWEGRSAGNAAARPSSAGEIRCAGTILKLARPAAVTRQEGGLSFTYRWPEEPKIEVIVRHRWSRRARAWTWTRELEIRSEARLASDLTVSLESGLGALPADTWLPLIDGVGAALGTNQTAAYRFAGALPKPGALLALPMLSVPAQPSSSRRRPGRLLLAADPYFSVLFTPTALEWTYPAQAGLENGCERRTIAISSHEGSPEQALDCFFRTVLADVPPGPRWLHDIALVDYDYMSDEGRGWFGDIDALTAALPKGDRHKVFLCLHGWYDFLGRYCFDSQARKFDSEWTAFSNYEAAKKAAAFGEIEGDRVELGFANCKPVKMSLNEVHLRLNYARSRGFRAGLYFADGMNAGDGLAGFDTNCVLRWGGWQGPDSKGRSYIQNPLHPKVGAFYLDYTRALLAEFGPDIDALNWDETFHIPPGQLGSEGAPGYADRAMMRLARELSRLVEDYNRQHKRQIAFLTSDCQGAFGQELKAPYALVAHGTFQDSWCKPQAWSYGIFSNYRNVLWSCCWWPLTKWGWIDFAVRQYQAPVSLSNGWGNDKGLSEMTGQERARALALFNWRKDKPTKLKWFDQLPAYGNERP